MLRIFTYNIDRYWLDWARSDPNSAQICQISHPNRSSRLDDSHEGLLACWRVRRPVIALSPDLPRVSLLVWADSVFVLASSSEEMAVGVVDVSRMVRELEMLSNAYAGEGESGIPETGEKFVHVQVLRVRGFGLDSQCSAQTVFGSLRLAMMVQASGPAPGQGDSAAGALGPYVPGSGRQCRVDAVGRGTSAARRV